MVNKEVEELVEKPKKNPIKKFVIFLGIIFIISLIILFGFYQFFYKIPTPELYQWDCFAIATTNPYYCKEMEIANYTFQEGELDNCYDEVYARRAILTSDSSLCEKMLSLDEGKIICEAITKKDVTICDKITQSVGNIVCKSALNKDVSHCDILEGTFVSYPFGPLFPEDAKIACQSDAYSWLAIIEHDISYCEKIRLLEPSSIYYKPYIHCRGAATGDIKYCTGRVLGNFFAKSEEDNAQFLRKQLGFLDWKP